MSGVSTTTARPRPHAASGSSPPALVADTSGPRRFAIVAAPVTKQAPVSVARRPRAVWRRDPLLADLDLAVAGPVSPATRVFRLPGAFELESGALLPRVDVAYRTWGRLDRSGDNAVLVCHALTGSADVDAWWSGLLGPGRALDPDRDFIVASNVLGSCYGTTGPLAPVDTGLPPWGPDFPAITVRDMVRLQAALLDHLGVGRLRLVLGGSLGGMQVLEWAALYGDRVDAIAPIAVSGRHSAWCIGLSEAQRQAIFADPAWRGGRYPATAPPAAGLAAARMIAMCSYRSRESFEARFAREDVESGGEAGWGGAGEDGGPASGTGAGTGTAIGGGWGAGACVPRGSFAVASYLRHQGTKLVARFDANAYVALTRAMDRHDLGRGRGRYEQVLRTIATPALVVAIDSDVLYPPVEQRELASLLPGAELAWLRSPHGHDAFLIEDATLDRLLRRFRERVRDGKRAGGAVGKRRHGEGSRADGGRKGGAAWASGS